MQEPADKPGVASFCRALLNQGTTTRSAEADRRPDRFGRRHASASAPGNELTYVERRRHQGPDGPGARAGRRHRRASGVRARGDRSAAQAGAVGACRSATTIRATSPTAVFDRLVFGCIRTAGRTRARRSRSRGSRAMTSSRFTSAWFAPNNALLAIVGDLTADEAFAAAEKAFGSWAAKDVPDVKPVGAARAGAARRRDRSARIGADRDPRRASGDRAHASRLPAVRPGDSHPRRRRRQPAVRRAADRPRPDLRRVGRPAHVQERRRCRRARPTRARRRPARRCG